MREIPDDVLKCLENGEKFVYCYEVIKDKKRSFFTAHNEILVINEDKYLPYSGMNPVNISFNDSAQDLIEITGIFEDKGISFNDDLLGRYINVSLYFLTSCKLYHLAQYFCQEMVKQDLSFKIILESITLKLKQSVLESYGKDCRASFGDLRCGVDKALYPQGTFCDKKFITCCNQFNNAVNFRGEPFIPELS